MPDDPGRDQCYRETKTYFKEKSAADEYCLPLRRVVSRVCHEYLLWSYLRRRTFGLSGTAGKGVYKG
ncbi:hypothetical protein B5F07_20570 [Lachnoclostridium sp. An169]|nr:hypothetical protein B5F07_20570 [Lachnoclostridium sp. An169]